MNPQETLLYWIRERWNILQKKEAGLPKPWSEDRVFQTTYFCNVHRENDKVTRWIRGFTAGRSDHYLFEYNIALCRFLNFPDTIAEVGFQEDHEPDLLLAKLEHRAARGEKVWGNAYVITTHGMKMPKARYLCHDVLGALYERRDAIIAGCRYPPGGGACATASRVLQAIDGIGSFLAGQIVADLKNSPGHPLYAADDKATFVEPGPGSIKGVQWFWTGTHEFASKAKFEAGFKGVREYVDKHWPEGIPPVDNQDLQNCLCEYDKYMRVSTGSGRSKRGYNGS